MVNISFWQGTSKISVNCRKNLCRKEKECTYYKVTTFKILCLCSNPALTSYYSKWHSFQMFVQRTRSMCTAWIPATIARQKDSATSWRALRAATAKWASTEMQAEIAFRKTNALLSVSLLTFNAFVKYWNRGILYWMLLSIHKYWIVIRFWKV